MRAMPAWLVVAAACGGSTGPDETVPEPVHVAPTVEAETPAEEPPPQARAEPEPPFGRTGETEMRWWASVRAADGAEQRWDLSTERFAARVAGFRCSIAGASASQRVHVQHGEVRRSTEEIRVLVCARGTDRRTARARCAVVAGVPEIEPATLEVGDPQAPHVVTLACEPVPREPPHLL